MPRPGRRLLAWLALAVVACSPGPADGGPSLEEILASDWDALEVEVLSDVPEEQRGGSAVIFLHGYGGRGPWMRPVAERLLDTDRRIFLPTSVVPHGRGRGAMWWEFDGVDSPRPYSSELAGSDWSPSRQLARAREAVLALVREIRERHAPERIALVGYSQGAMLALDVALAEGAGIDRVALIAGFVLIDTLPRISGTRESTLPIFIAHGRNDPIVDYGHAERARELLGEAGFPVVFEPHAGNHSIKAATIGPLRDFLAGGE